MCQETRVIVIGGNFENNFYHGNVVLFGNGGSFLAMQSPILYSAGKEETARKFWYLALQHDVKDIVMLTDFYENGVKKSMFYIPLEVGHVYPSHPANVTLKCLSKTVDEELKITTRKLSVEWNSTPYKEGGKKLTAEIMHHQYTGWPDGGLPENTASVVALLKRVADKKTPTIVHCVDGIGRTGIFLDIEFAKQFMLTSNDSSDLATLVAVRTYRARAVVKTIDLIFCHIATADYLKDNFGNPQLDENTQALIDRAFEALKKHLPKEVLQDEEKKKGLLPESPEYIKMIADSFPQKKVDEKKKKQKKPGKTAEAKTKTKTKTTTKTKAKGKGKGKSKSKHAPAKKDKTEDEDSLDDYPDPVFNFPPASEAMIKHNCKTFGKYPEYDYEAWKAEGRALVAAEKREAAEKQAAAEKAAEKQKETPGDGKKSKKSKKSTKKDVSLEEAVPKTAEEGFSAPPPPAAPSPATPETERKEGAGEGWNTWKIPRLYRVPGGRTQEEDLLLSAQTSENSRSEGAGEGWSTWKTLFFSLLPWRRREVRENDDYDIEASWNSDSDYSD